MVDVWSQFPDAQEDPWAQFPDAPAAPPAAAVAPGANTMSTANPMVAEAPAPPSAADIALSKMPADMRAAHHIQSAAQAGLRGLGADIAGAPIDIPVALFDAANWGVNKVANIFGDTKPDIPGPGIQDIPFVGKYLEPTMADTIASLFSKGDEAITGTPPLGPEDRGSGEQAFALPIELAAASAGTGGLLAGRVPALKARVAAANEGGPVINKPLDSLVRQYADNPTKTIIGDAGAGFGSGVGHDQAQKISDDPVTGMLGMLLGGVGGASVANVGRAGVETVAKAPFKVGTDKNLPQSMETLAPYKKSAVDAAAAKLQGAATDLPTARANIEANWQNLKTPTEPGALPVRPEQMPTTGLLSQDPGLVSQENVARIAPESGPKFVARDQEVKGAAADRVASLKDPTANQDAVRTQAEAYRGQQIAPAQAAEDAARTQADTISTARTQEGAALAARGGAQRGAEASRALDTAVVDQGYVPARAQKNEMFNAVDPTRTEMIDAAPVIDAARRVREGINALGPQGQQLPAEFVARLERLEPRIENVDGVPTNVGGPGEVAVGDLVDLRKYLSTARSNARKSGNFELADNIGDLQIAVNEATQNSPGAAAANANYGQFAERYRPGPGDEGAKFTKEIDRDNTRTSTPPEKTAGRFLGAPEKAAALNRILTGAPSEAAGRTAVRDYVMSDFASSVVGADGAINPARAAAWARNNGDVLAQFPAVRSEIDQMIASARNGETASTAATANLRAARERTRQTAEEFDRSAAGTLLREDPRDVASRVLGGKYGADSEIDQINTALRNDPEATRGWKAAVAEVLHDRVTNSKKVGESFEVSHARLANEFKANEKILAKVFSPEEMNLLRQGHKLMGFFKEAEKRATVGSQTAPNFLSSMAGKAFQVAMRHVYGNLEAGGVIARTRLMLELLPSHQQAVTELMNMAWFDPGVAAYLLNKKIKGKPGAPYNGTLLRLMSGRQVSNDQMNDGEEQ